MKTAVVIDGLPLEVPLGWEEITYSQYLLIRNGSDSFSTLAALSGFDEARLQEMPIELMVSLLASVRAMLDDEIPLYQIDEIAGMKLPKDIGLMEFARKVNVDELVRRKIDAFQLLVNVVAIYTATGIEDEDIADTLTKLQGEKFVLLMSAGDALIKKYNLLCASENKIERPAYEPEELSAGVKSFEIFGVFGLVRGIALRWGVMVDDVYKWSYNRVLLELKYSAHENKYERKLRNILTKKT